MTCKLNKLTISIHKALASLDPPRFMTMVLFSFISIHKALASLDCNRQISHTCIDNFNPQGSREPRLQNRDSFDILKLFQSTRLSRASTHSPLEYRQPFVISIHKALASLDGGNVRKICLQQYFNPQGSREPRLGCIIVSTDCHPISIHKALASLDCFVTTLTTSVFNFNPQGSREPRQQNYPNLLHIPPNILCIMLFSPQFNQFSPFTQPAFTAFSSVFQVRISLAFHVSLAFAPGLKGSQLTETNSTYILHNPSFPAYILHAAKPLPPPTDTLSIQASFVPDIWLPA